MRKADAIITSKAIERRELTPATELAISKKDSLKSVVLLSREIGMTKNAIVSNMRKVYSLGKLRECKVFFYLLIPIGSHSVDLL